jgi:hypothetical protein
MKFLFSSSIRSSASLCRWTSSANFHSSGFMESITYWYRLSFKPSKLAMASPITSMTARTLVPNIEIFEKNCIYKK